MAKYRHAKKPSPLNIALFSAGALLLVVLLILGIVALAGGFSNDESEKVTPTTATVAPTVQPTVEVPTVVVDEDPGVKYTTMAQEYMSTMTEDEKIYQMLMVTPEVLTGVDNVTLAGEATKQAIEAYPVGGIYYSSNNFENEAQTTELIANTKSFAKHPLFIAVSEEGGEDAPVASTLGGTEIDYMSTYSEQGELTAFNNADAIAKNLAKYGFNFNFAPTAVLTGDNAYSQDPNTAGELVTQAMKAYQSNNIVSMLKSFPSILDNNSTEMTNNEFIPFICAFKENADSVMVSDCMLSAYDDVNPAFMSVNVVTNTLIKKLYFNGLIMSPMLSSENLNSYSIDDIVVKAINAGVNMFVCPSNIDDYVSTIKAALESNRITQQQIDESVVKILALKFKYGIITEDSSAPQTTEDPTNETQVDPTTETLVDPSETQETPII